MASPTQGILVRQMCRELTSLVWNLRRILKGRIDRNDATRRIEELLRRLQQPTPDLRRVSRVVVYGSYARGALRVGDVDLAIDYEGGREMLDWVAIATAVPRLAVALRAVEAVAPTLAGDLRPRAQILADDGRRLRRQLTNGLPAVSAMYDPLLAPPKGNPAAAIDDVDLARLEKELADAAASFDAALTSGLPFPGDTPSLAPVENLKRMIRELTDGDDRLSIYYSGAEMPHDRALENPGGLWVWRLLWERGDSLDKALKRLHGIAPDPIAGRARRSRQKGPGFKS